MGYEVLKSGYQNNEWASRILLYLGKSSYFLITLVRNSTTHLTLRYKLRYLVAVISYRYAVKHNMVQGTYLHCTKYLRYFVITINYISTFITQGKVSISFGQIIYCLQKYSRNYRYLIIPL